MTRKAKHQKINIQVRFTDPITRACAFLSLAKDNLQDDPRCQASMLDTIASLEASLALATYQLYEHQEDAIQSVLENRATLLAYKAGAEKSTVREAGIANLEDWLGKMRNALKCAEMDRSQEMSDILDREISYLKDQIHDGERRLKQMQQGPRGAPETLSGCD